MNDQQLQQTLVLAAIGDLEVTRRQLILEIQARDERIVELEAQLGAALNGNGVDPVGHRV